MNFKLLFITFLSTFVFANAQIGFTINSNKNKVSIPFKFINNLIFIPINVNGTEMNFMLDTGVEETVMFGLEDAEKEIFKNTEKIQLKGFGSDDYAEGLKSSNNQLSCKNYTDNDHDLYIILNQDFNFSSQIGIPVSGIIGSKFFKNHLVEINYSSHRIIIHKENYKIRKIVNKKFSFSTITLEKNKPYLKTNIEINGNQYETKMLIDSGSGDAVWVFENQKNKIKIPNQNFDDFLGRGFTGDLYGKRARIDNLKINDFNFKKPLTSFPDSLAIINSRLVKDREGSIGGEILKRFTVVFDYPNQKMYFKKNSNFNLPFNFNMSGIEIEHEGLQWISESSEFKTAHTTKVTYDEPVVSTSNIKYSFSLKPIFIISNIRKGSPAEQCGLLKHDIITEINDTQIFNYSLQEINEMLKSEEGKTIRVKVNRKGIQLEFKFQLKSIL